MPVVAVREPQLGVAHPAILPATPLLGSKSKHAVSLSAGVRGAVWVGVALMRNHDVIGVAVTFTRQARA